jgi:hypothetical protein
MGTTRVARHPSPSPLPPLANPVESVGVNKALSLSLFLSLSLSLAISLYLSHSLGRYIDGYHASGTAPLTVSAAAFPTITHLSLSLSWRG